MNLARYLYKVISVDFVLIVNTNDTLVIQFLAKS